MIQKTWNNTYAIVLDDFLFPRLCFLIAFNLRFSWLELPRYYKISIWYRHLFPHRRHRWFNQIIFDTINTNSFFFIFIFKVFQDFKQPSTLTWIGEYGYENDILLQKQNKLSRYYLNLFYQYTKLLAGTLKGGYLWLADNFTFPDHCAF